MTMKHLRMDSVDVRFGKVEALSGVALELHGGEVTLLAGPNGSGKSTLMRVLLGLIRAHAGTLEIDGRSRRVDNAFKSRVGYLPEAVAFPDNLSGKQVLRFFARARGVPKERVAEVLEQVGLSHAARRAVRGYSRGMRQRLGLAVAVLGRPDLLILDEPTGGLDQEGLAVLWKVLAAARARGAMVLMSSHDLALAERRVDRVCVLRQGKVVATGRPAELREEVELPVRVTFGLSHDRPAVGALEEAIARWPVALGVIRENNHVSVDVAPRHLLELMDVRAAHREAIARLRVEEPGLDQVYEALLRQPEEDAR